MNCTGRIVDASMNLASGKYQVTFEVNERQALLEGFDEIKDCEKLEIKATKYRQKRSLDANAMLWLCLGRIATALKSDVWEVYLQMLKRYGKFTYIVVKENAVEAVKTQWRETEIVGEVTVNGKKAVQMLCFFGSSTLNSKEFSNLLDGVFSEMKEMGLETPMPDDVRVVIERYEKEWQKRNK